jgi:hypothetical protein
LNVPADTPAFDQGETAENPIPLPNASSTKVSAAVATPPAIIAAQEVADWPESTTVAVSLLTESIIAMLRLKLLVANARLVAELTRSSSICGA